MDVPFGGGCACGAIRYACAAAPRYMGNCHCRDCQQATGGAYMPVVVVNESDFSLLGGEPNWFERPSDRGNPMRRAFCPACGTPLFLTNGAHEGCGRSMREAWMIRAGSSRAGRSTWRAHSPGVSCTRTCPTTKACRRGASDLIERFV